MFSEVQGSAVDVLATVASCILSRKSCPTCQNGFAGRFAPQNPRTKATNTSALQKCLFSHVYACECCLNVAAAAGEDKTCLYEFSEFRVVPGGMTRC